MTQEVAQGRAKPGSQSKGRKKALPGISKLWQLGGVSCLPSPCCGQFQVLGLSLWLLQTCYCSAPGPDSQSSESKGESCSHGLRLGVEGRRVSSDLRISCCSSELGFSTQEKEVQPEHGCGLIHLSAEGRKSTGEGVCSCKRPGLLHGQAFPMHIYVYLLRRDFTLDFL